MADETEENPAEVSKPPEDSAAEEGAGSGAPSPDEAGSAGPSSDSSGSPGRSSSMLWMIVAVGVVLIGCGAGFGVSRLLGGSSPGRQAEPAAGEPEGQASDTGQGEPNAKDQEHLYYDFEPIVVNLDEPRLGRHIKATITLAIKKENHKAATGLLDKKMPELKNWMMVFLAGCSLDEVRGAKNLNRLRREIQERFNERLWPDRKPMIEEVLFKEFSVQ